MNLLVSLCSSNQSSVAYLLDQMIRFLGLVMLAVDRTFLVIEAELHFQFLAEHGTRCNTSGAELSSERLEVPDILLDL